MGSTSGTQCFIIPMSARKYIRHSSGQFPKSSFHFLSDRVFYTNPPNPSDFKGPTNMCATVFQDFRNYLLINQSKNKLLSCLFPCVKTLFYLTVLANNYQLKKHALWVDRTRYFFILSTNYQIHSWYFVLLSAHFKRLSGLWYAGFLLSIRDLHRFFLSYFLFL